MSQIFLQPNLRSRTTLVFVAAVLIVASLQVVSVLHNKAYPRPHLNLSNRETDLVFLATFPPCLSRWSTSSGSASVSRDKAQAKQEPGPLAVGDEFTITQQQRVLHVVYRLARFSGSAHGLTRVCHLFVSLLGILGMFAAIVGALIGPWLADTADDTNDEDRFTYWVRDDEDDEDEERTCGFAREEKYGLHRMLEMP